MARSRTHPPATEVDAYVFIKDALRSLGWDARNPSRVAEGQVWTQNECQADEEIKARLGLEKPENIVKVTDKVLWVIEAKRTHGELQKSINEAADYATKINKGKGYTAAFISGVAGNEGDTFLIRTRFLKGREFVPVSMNGEEITGLLSPQNCEQILRNGTPNLDNPPIDERLFISRAERINEILHLGAVNPHQRASVMAALLLSKLSSTGPNIEEKSPTTLIGDINARVQTVLQNQKKPEFYDYIRIALPASQDNHVKFRQALVHTIQQLDLLNIRSAMNSGADWLGTFYEVFLKYANWAQDLGIVLTPRHITRFVADVMAIRPNDLIFDPTCGTGGFLVAAFDTVKKRANANQLGAFKRNSVFGIEQDSGIAALAVVNMIFRGDGKNNIIEGNCFAKFLKRSTNNGATTAKFTEAQPDDPPITKVMMNPPFALKRGAEKEHKFIEQALHQMEDGGTLFSVVPYSAMVRPGGYLSWRKNQLLPAHTLLAVVTFPIDLFYPVGVTSAGIFVRKGIPHKRESLVLWIRALTDGLLKSKGKRLPNPRATNDLAQIHDLLRAYVDNPSQAVESKNQLVKSAPIDFSDRQLELVPEAYLDQAEPTHSEVVSGMAIAIRDLFAYLVKIEQVTLRPDLLATSETCTLRPKGWKRFVVTDFFEIKRGHFHSIANLDPGELPTISRVSTDNGLVGRFDKPPKAKIWPSGTITVSTVNGDTFIQPVRFIATDNVLMCTPKDGYGSIGLEFRLFAQLMINAVKWRYSYGRQCYRRKFEKTEIVMPVKGGELDVDYMRQVVRSSKYWPLVESVMAK
jgi:type I restriction enzyme M protein